MNNEDMFMDCSCSDKYKANTGKYNINVTIPCLRSPRNTVRDIHHIVDSTAKKRVTFEPDHCLVQVREIPNVRRGSPLPEELAPCDPSELCGEFASLSVTSPASRAYDTPGQAVNGHGRSMKHFAEFCGIRAKNGLRSADRKGVSKSRSPAPKKYVVCAHSDVARCRCKCCSAACSVVTSGERESPRSKGGVKKTTRGPVEEVGRPTKSIKSPTVHATPSHKSTSGQCNKDCISGKSGRYPVFKQDIMDRGYHAQSRSFDRFDVMNKSRSRDYHQLHHGTSPGGVSSSCDAPLSRRPMSSPVLPRMHQSPYRHCQSHARSSRTPNLLEVNGLRSSFEGGSPIRCMSADTGSGGFRTRDRSGKYVLGVTPQKVYSWQVANGMLDMNDVETPYISPLWDNLNSKPVSDTGLVTSAL